MNNTEQIEAEVNGLIDLFIRPITEHVASEDWQNEVHKTSIKVNLVYVDLIIKQLESICNHDTVWVGDDKSAEPLEDTIAHYQSIKQNLESRL